MKKIAKVFDNSEVLPHRINASVRRIVRQNLRLAREAAKGSRRLYDKPTGRWSPAPSFVARNTPIASVRYSRYSLYKCQDGSYRHSVDEIR